MDDPYQTASYQTNRPPIAPLTLYQNTPAPYTLPPEVTYPGIGGGPVQTSNDGFVVDTVNYSRCTKSKNGLPLDPLHIGQKHPKYSGIKYQNQATPELAPKPPATQSEISTVGTSETGQLWWRLVEAHDFWIEKDSRRPKKYSIYVNVALEPVDTKSSFDTEISKGSNSHPKLNEEGIFNIQSLTFQKLVFQVWDSKKFPAKPERLGDAELPLIVCSLYHFKA